MNLGIKLEWAIVDVLKALEDYLKAKTATEELRQKNQVIRP